MSNRHSLNADDESEQNRAFRSPNNGALSPSNTMQSYKLSINTDERGRDYQFEDDSPGHLSSDSDSLDDDILRSVDAFSDYDERDRLGITYDELLDVQRRQSMNKSLLKMSFGNQDAVRMYSVDVLA